MLKREQLLWAGVFGNLLYVLQETCQHSLMGKPHIITILREKNYRLGDDLVDRIVDRGLRTTLLPSMPGLTFTL